MKRLPPCQVGDRVRLNDKGLKAIGGLTSLEMIRQARNIFVTSNIS